MQIPETPHSFALIYSIEDPDGKNEHSGVGVQVCEGETEASGVMYIYHTSLMYIYHTSLFLVRNILWTPYQCLPLPLPLPFPFPFPFPPQLQVMGPDDGYICQFSRETSSFWADRNDLLLGAGIKAGAETRGVTSTGIKVGRMLPVVSQLKLPEVSQWHNQLINHPSLLV